MKLAQFMKYRGLVFSGGEAKQIISSGLITVNGLVETRRGRKLCPGDVVCFNHDDYIVSYSEL